MRHFIIDFDSFDLISQPFVMPANTIVCRGYSTLYPPISDRPAYFTSKFNVACSYGSGKECQTGVFIITKPLKLIDLRHMSGILQYIFEHRKSNRVEVLDAIFSLTLSYGLCSLQKQIELVKLRFKDAHGTDSIVDTMMQYLHNETKKRSLNVNPVEIRGVRVGATVNDAISVTLLKELFPDADGYITPSMTSPYHIEKTNHVIPAEMVIFNPEKSNVKLIEDLKTVSDKIVYIHLSEILNEMHLLFAMPLKGDIHHIWEQKQGGGNGRKETVDTGGYHPNEWFDKNPKEITKLSRKAKRVVTMLRPVEEKHGHQQGSFPISPWPLASTGEV